MNIFFVGISVKKISQRERERERERESKILIFHSIRIFEREGECKL